MKFENAEVWGFEHAIRGMRLPMQSHNKSDSFVCHGGDKFNDCTSNCTSCPRKDDDGFNADTFCIGKNDLELMQKLIKAGSEHRKFMRQIFVSVDITAPLYWWKEFDTYKVGTVANSTSTMHKLATTPITIDCFEIDDCDFSLSCEKQFKTFTQVESVEDFVINGSNCFSLIDFLESLRQKYLETKDKRYWKELIRWLPESWLQTRTMTMNYENILNMVNQRKSHKLNEWSGIDNSELPNYINWAKSLPYAQELLFIDKK